MITHGFQDCISANALCPFCSLHIKIPAWNQSPLKHDYLDYKPECFRYRNLFLLSTDSACRYLFIEIRYVLPQLLKKCTRKVSLSERPMSMMFDLQSKHSYYKVIYPECVLACVWLSKTFYYLMMSLNFAAEVDPGIFFCQRTCCFARTLLCQHIDFIEMNKGVAFLSVSAIVCLNMDYDIYICLPAPSLNLRIYF